MISVRLLYLNVMCSGKGGFEREVLDTILYWDLCEAVVSYHYQYVVYLYELPKNSQILPLSFSTNWREGQKETYHTESKLIDHEFQYHLYRRN